MECLFIIIKNSTDSLVLDSQVIHDLPFFKKKRNGLAMIQDGVIEELFFPYF